MDSDGTFSCQLQVNAARVRHFLDDKFSQVSIAVHGRPWDIKYFNLTFIH